MHHDIFFFSCLFLLFGQNIKRQPDVGVGNEKSLNLVVAKFAEEPDVTGHNAWLFATFSDR